MIFLAPLKISLLICGISATTCGGIILNHKLNTEYEVEVSPKPVSSAPENVPENTPEPKDTQEIESKQIYAEVAGDTEETKTKKKKVKVYLEHLLTIKKELLKYQGFYVSWINSGQEIADLQELIAAGTDATENTTLKTTEEQTLATLKTALDAQEKIVTALDGDKLTLEQQHEDEKKIEASIKISLSTLKTEMAASKQKESTYWSFIQNLVVEPDDLIDQMKSNMNK